ncbi:hypothetical protein N1028_08290 [Herbiconiux sp. CPCC 203407]|uniref:SHOCT domain-containing protein n=1 Tax=Herbiconiux oxytropis TaxID=2970915 RepID=A0AA41XGM6_9MICO|nr:hypothetical protein [Herbiconiux oxytropis]MCS5723800.1 hypothetical protein [Herbiconiux oxytropis]MCS5725895.1 hypothetical protein [Herbiconiux oxytropis]
MLTTLTASAALAATAVAHPFDSGFGGPGFGGPGFGGPGFGGPGLFLLVPLFWILVAAILFAVFGRRWRRAAWERRSSELPGRRAESTLAERFAQGDIDETEYRARLEVLRANTPPPPR